jgi:hypothetical protein
MSDLDKYSEITDLNFEGDVHLAVTGRWQEFSANQCINALMTKSSSGENVPQDIMKSLSGSKIPEQILVKMSYSNMKRSLNETLEKFLKENMSSNGEYIWVDVWDFNDDMVAFRFQEQLWAVDYEATEDGVITIGEDLRVTSNRELYVDSETGEELIKASFWKKEQSPEVEELSDADGEIEGGAQSIEAQDTPDVEENEDNMSEKFEMTPEQLQEEIQKALVADRKEQEELRKAAELEANTQELVKGFAFVEEADHADLVKAIIAEGGQVLVKALEAAGAKIAGLEADLKKAGKQEVEVEEVVEQEVEKSAKEETPSDRTKQLDQIVKARLAAKKK